MIGVVFLFFSFFAAATIPNQAQGADAPAKAPPSGIRYPFAGDDAYFLINQDNQKKSFVKYKRTKVLVCYELMGDGTGYYLAPLSSEAAKTVANDIKDLSNCWDRDTSDDDTALIANEKIWIGIYVPPEKISVAAAISSITVSVASVSAIPVQVTPIRPSIGLPAIHGVADGAFYYFAWPYSLQGDTIPTVSIAAYAKKDTVQEPYNVGNETLSQVHQLSRFNISTAVIYSTLHTKTFGYSSDTPPIPIVTKQNAIIDPVVFLTYYPCPLDAERPFHWSDELKPGISLGISTSNPTSYFYFGLMSEFPGIRNVEIVYGATAAKISELPKDVLQPTASATGSSIPTPVTVSKYKVGAYVGLSFNVSGFLTGLFGKSS